jgi:RNA polymerase sigma factor (sigma-70 family)
MREPGSHPLEARWSAAAFATTHWSVVSRAADSRSPESAEALEVLCRSYWPPLYAYVRRRGRDVHDAQDVVQEFLRRLLEQKDLGHVDSHKGKFRSFLLASMNHFLANEWNRSQTQKRGGGRIIFSLDQALLDGVPGVEPFSTATPEKEFEARWAEAVIKRVLEQLRLEWERRYQARHFDDFKVFLMEERGAAPFAEAAARLGISESALKSIVHRLRKRYRELFREEIAHTVSSPEEIDEEIRFLFAALGD